MSSNRSLKHKLAEPHKTDSVVVQHPAETSVLSLAGIVGLLVAFGVLDEADEDTVLGIAAALGLVPALVTKYVTKLKERFGG